MTHLTPEVLEKIRRMDPFKFSRMLCELNLKVNTGDNAILHEVSEAFLAKTDVSLNPDFRLLKIDNDLIPIVSETRNSFFYRPSILRHIFINNDFTINETEIKGIFIEDSPNRQNWYVGIFFIKDGCTDLRTDHLVSCDEDLSHTIMKKENPEYFDKINDVMDIAKTMACNVIDMITGNREDIEVVEISASDERQGKRLSRGKELISPTVIIRPTNEFRKYLNHDFNRYYNHCNYKFLVRGHWRHFRSEKYSESKRGTKQWIKPYYKGEGILVAKEYLLKWDNQGRPNLV